MHTHTVMIYACMEGQNRCGPCIFMLWSHWQPTLTPKILVHTVLKGGLRQFINCKVNRKLMHLSQAAQRSARIRFCFFGTRKLCPQHRTPSSSCCATPLAKMFCWHAKVRSLRWPLCHSLCQMLATYQLSCDRGVAGRGRGKGAATSCEVR